MLRRPLFVRMTLRDEVIEGHWGFSPFSSSHQLEFPQLLDIIQAVRRHKRARMLILVVQKMTVDWSQIEEIHRELDLLHQAGKQSLVLLEEAGNKSYYLACGAQRVFLTPCANLELVGLRAELLFFKEALDFLGVEPELYSVGTYKSAGEVFTRVRMSEASRRMSDSILEDLQSRMCRKVAVSRGVAQEKVQEWIDQGPYTARHALEQGLVDGLLYEDELESMVEKEIPGIRNLPSSRLRIREGFLKRALTRWRPQIAYLVVEGLITQGKSRRGMGRRPVAGSDTLRSLLKQACQSRRVKAILLRVNSPGGSAHASDLIWRAVKVANQQKPVIVSFGSVAASGGYYIATASRRILAMPGTLTGSIGVIGGKFNFQGLLGKLRIAVDSLEKGGRAGYASPTRPFSEAEARTVKEQLEEFYRIFLEKVAEARQATVEEIGKVAEGRVWTGSQAGSRGLVDEMGGIRAALGVACREAGLSEGKVRVVQFSKRRHLRDLLGLPFLPTVEAQIGTRLWAIMPQRWVIR
ncbi:MAG: signal peptide peptidase SppA [Acidobacteriota bacterium]